MLVNKYYFDWFNENVLARGGAAARQASGRSAIETLIDGGLVNGSAKTVGVLGRCSRAACSPDTSTTTRSR